MRRSIRKRTRGTRLWGVHRAAIHSLLIVFALALAAACGDGGPTSEDGERPAGGRSAVMSDFERLLGALDQLEQRVAALEIATDELFASLGRDGDAVSDLVRVVAHLEEEVAALEQRSALLQGDVEGAGRCDEEFRIETIETSNQIPQPVTLLCAAPAASTDADP